MAEDKKPQSIFQGVVDAINGGKKKTPTAPASAQFAPNKADGLVNSESPIEEMQQQFLDWQVNKIAHNLYTRSIYFDTDRISAYQDFRAMDMSPEIAAALNIIRDECLTRSEKGNILEIYSENSRVKEILKDLFGNRINVDYNLKLWIRDLVKYGDYFVFLEIDKTEGIYNFLSLPVEEIHREEAYDGNPESVRFRWETMGMYFEDWQVAHFRMLEDTKKLPYGRSILDPARKLWKQLQLAEDSMLVYRITRAPERRVFYIEVGNLGDQDVQGYMMKIQNQIKKQPVVDSRNGQYNLKYDPMNITEDYFIPIRGDKSSKIDTLPGACLALDTKIALLDGRNLELSEIIKEWDGGNRNLWVYSCDPKTGEFAPGMITWAGITRKNTEVLKLTLDNGETITLTPDHKMLTKSGKKVEAQNLKIGDSLMPFNVKKENLYKGISGYEKDYEMVYDNLKQDWVWTHRVVADYFKGNLCKEYVFKEDQKQKNVRHHKDFNRFNNAPSNICFMGFSDHMKLHSDMIHLASEAFSKKYNEDENFAIKVRKNLEIGNKIHHTLRNNNPKYKKLVDENQKIGMKKYWSNISEDEKINRDNINKINFKKGSDKLQDLLKDDDYKKTFYEKTSKALKIVKNTKENKERQSKITKTQWLNENFRNSVIEKQTIKYSDNLLKFVVNRFKEGMPSTQILKDINEEGSVFMSEFDSLNVLNKQLHKMKNGFTHNNLSKMMMHFGYKNWNDFKSKVEFFNHKIVSIEWLEEKQDTGTITVDGNELYHDFHTFALTAGVYNFNSNMGDIQDIEYLQNKLFASLQVPKAYLNYAENLPGGSTLSQADLRFSRTINSIQEVILLELRRIANIHLFFSGLKDEVDNFTLTLTNPSTQQELLKLETMKARMEVFKEMYSSESNSPVSYTWAMENLLGFSKAEIKLILKQKKVEKKIFAEIDASVETYKKIGLFKELDDRYELPGATPAGAATTGEEGGAGGGGGGATGGMGNIELGSQLGGMDAGGGADLGGAPDAGGAEEVPLAENRIVKIKRVLAESDRNADDLLLDLLGNTEDAPTLAEREENENKLLHKNKKLNYKIQKMIENIQTSLDDTKKEERDENEKKFQEIKTKNTLFERSGMVIDRTNSMFKHLEEMMSGNKVSGFDVEKVDIINEEFIEEVELNEEIIEDINEIPNEDSEDKTEE